MSSDLVSTALLASACFRAGTPDALTVADALVPALERHVAGADPKAWTYPISRVDRNQKKQNLWLTWTLLRIEKMLEKQERPFEWLRRFREQTGQIKFAT